MSAAGVSRPALAAAAIASALVASVAAAPSPVTRGSSAPRGTVVLCRMRAPSFGGAWRTLRVYLPPSYAVAPRRRYPVVYLLHGWPGSNRDWFARGRAATTADTLIARRRMPETLIVCPDGQGRGVLGRSLYLDAWDGTGAVASFLTRDVVAWVDATFRTRPTRDQRAIAGLSDGGSGALDLALRHPELFRACASTSGTYRWKHPFGVGRVLGRGPGASRTLAEHSVLAEVERDPAAARRLTIAFDCGRSDPEARGARELHARLTALGVPHVYHEFRGGHSWSYWRSRLAETLEILTAGMSTAG